MTATQLETRRPLPGELRPPRVNAAGVCVVCGDRCEDAPKCLAYWATSLWGICPSCDGVQHDEDGMPCGCWSGAVEHTPCSLAAAVEDRKAARRSGRIVFSSDALRLAEHQ